MSIQPHRLALPFLAVLVAACAAHRSEEQARSGGGVTSRNGAIVISGAALEDGSGSLLSAIQGKVPNLRIQRSTSQCPRISLRSHATSESFANPHVYVDGTRLTDTCILESLRSRDVASVEVYPMGFTNRPGYGMHAHGLILVFMRSS